MTYELHVMHKINTKLYNICIIYIFREREREREIERENLTNTTTLGTVVSGLNFEVVLFLKVLPRIACHSIDTGCT